MTTKKERRDPVPESAKYYLRNARDESQSLSDRHFSLREAFNHLENEAFAEAEEADRLKAESEALRKLNAGLNDENKRLQTEIEQLGSKVAMHCDKARGDYWAWQGDGEDHLESLVCPVLIPATVLLKLLDENATLRRWCKQMIVGLQHVAEVNTADLESDPGLRHLHAHAIGSLMDPAAVAPDKLSIPAEFERMDAGRTIDLSEDP